MESPEVSFSGDVIRKLALVDELPTARRRVVSVLRALEAGPNRDLLFDLHPDLVDVLEELNRLVVGATRRGDDDPADFACRGSLADKLMALGWTG